MKYSPCGECEIIHFVNCEISRFAFGSARCEMKFAHIRVSEYFTFAEQIFHSEAISLARRANFTEKSHPLARMAFFLAGAEGFRTRVCASGMQISDFTLAQTVSRPPCGLEWVRSVTFSIKTKRTAKAVLLVLAGAEGFEPTTNGFGDRDSTS